MGEGPLPHAYINIPMGYVCTARKSLADYAVPQYRTTRKSLADYAVPQCRTTHKPLMGLHRFSPGIGTIPKKSPIWGCTGFDGGVEAG